MIRTLTFKINISLIFNIRGILAPDASYMGQSTTQPWISTLEILSFLGAMLTPSTGKMDVIVNYFELYKAQQEPSQIDNFF